jgi:hypothetical protein
MSTHTQPRSQQSPAPDRWMNAANIAARCGISVSSVQKLSQHPDCPVIRPEGVRRCLYDLAEFREWLKAGNWKHGRSRVREVRRG